MAVSASFATLWFAEAESGRGDEVWSDPFVLAAACAVARSSLHLGVVAGDGAARHPSVVAREVTALDHVSGGRAALCLDYPGCLTEAATICRAMCTEGEATVEGRVYRTQGAVNRPQAVHVDGLPLVARVRTDGQGTGELGELVGAAGSARLVDALWVSDEASVSAARDATAGLADAPAVVWVGSLPPPDAEGDDGGGAARRVVAQLVAAGVQGVVCRVGDLGQVTEASLTSWARALEQLDS